MRTRLSVRSGNTQNQCSFGLSFRGFLAQSRLGLISSQHVGDKVRAVENDEGGEVVPDCLVKDIKEPVDHPANAIEELAIRERHAYLALIFLFVDHCIVTCCA